MGISLQRFKTSLVLLTLIGTASFNFSSNLTVAAMWKTIDTSRIRVARSCEDIPRFGWLQSPAMATIWCRNFGCSSLSLSNSYSNNDKLIKLRENSNYKVSCDYNQHVVKSTYKKKSLYKLCTCHINYTYIQSLRNRFTHIKRCIKRFLYL